MSASRPCRPAPGAQCGGGRRRGRTAPGSRSLTPAGGWGAKVAAASSGATPGSLRSIRTICGRSAARGGAGRPAAPASPGSRPQRRTKFPREPPEWLRSAEPGGPAQKKGWLGLSGLRQPLWPTRRRPESVRRTLRCRRGTCGVSGLGSREPACRSLHHRGREWMGPA